MRIWGRSKSDFKKVGIILWLECYQRVVWILLQITAFDLKLQLENLHGQKSTVWKTAITCVFTNIMNNSAQLKEGELQFPALFLLIILEMCPSAAFECAACACFHKNCVFDKIHAKFVKPWVMKKLLWDGEKGNRMKPYDKRWNHQSSEVCYRTVSLFRL